MEEERQLIIYCIYNTEIVGGCAKNMIKTSEFKVELYFAKKPSQETIDGLKVCGWKWDSKKFCWYNKKNDENMLLAKSIDEKSFDYSVAKEQNHYHTVPKVTIKMTDIIVRTNSFYCNLHHNVNDVIGHILIICKNGEIKEKSVSLTYCSKCSTYYILEETYNEMKKYGILCGRIMTKNEYLEHKELDTTYWKEKSPLKMWGYSVSKADDLSREQRWEILERIVDTGIMTLDRELSYLDFFIKLSTNEDSIYCWTEDRHHMEKHITKYAGHVLLT